MGRQVGLRVAQTAEVNDALHAGRLGSSRAIASCHQIPFQEIDPAAQTVDEIIHRMHVAHSRDQRLGLQHVSACQFHLL